MDALTIDEQTQFPDEAFTSQDPKLPEMPPVDPSLDEQTQFPATLDTIPKLPEIPTVDPIISDLSDKSEMTEQPNSDDKSDSSCATCKKNSPVRRHRKIDAPKKKLVRNITPLATVRFYAGDNNSIFMAVD
jgi:hypothetical protein